jgi:hypothetical protein
LNVYDYIVVSHNACRHTTYLGQLLAEEDNTRLDEAAALARGDAVFEHARLHLFDRVRTLTLHTVRVRERSVRLDKQRSVNTRFALERVDVLRVVTQQPAARC